jgi:hypothetical protein
MASTELSRRVGKAVGYPPLCDMSDLQRSEFQEALLDAHGFEDLIPTPEDIPTAPLPRTARPRPR